jgi:hypothetical protein
MTRYQEFLSDVAEYTSTYYDFALPSSLSLQLSFGETMPDLTGPKLLASTPYTPNEIRKARVFDNAQFFLCTLDWNAVVCLFGPHQLGIKTPSWIWRLMSEVLYRRDPYERELVNPDTLLTFDPLAEKRPGMYAYEKRILWDAFAGLPADSPAPRVSLSSFIEPSVFQRSASTYLHYLISIGQALHKARMAQTLGAGQGTAVIAGAAIDSTKPQAAADIGVDTDVSTSADHHGTD